MDFLIGQAAFAEVRSLIDINIDARVLPDTVMVGDTFLGAAHDWLLARIPDAASKTGDERNRIQRALKYYLAALLCPTISLTTATSNQIVNASWSTPAKDLRARATELFGLATGEVAWFDPGDDLESVSLRAGVFATGSGTRGKM